MKDKRDKKELTRLILTALILAGGSIYWPVAEATDIPITSNTELPADGQTSNGLTTDGYNIYANKDAQAYSDKDSITITGVPSGYTGYNFYGGYNLNIPFSDNNKGCTITLKGGTVKSIYGLYNFTASRNSCKNTVNIYGGTVSSDVVGGRGGGATQTFASNNTVVINPTDGNIEIDGDIYGSYGYHGYNSSVTISKASNNSNTITFGGNTVVYGGYCNAYGTAYGNTVNINSGVSLFGIVGGQRTDGLYQYNDPNIPTNTGNKLNLGSSGITVTGSGTAKASGVKGFETIAITSGVNFTGGTLLSVTGTIYSDGNYKNNNGSILPTLDITGASGLTGETAPGTKTLITAGNDLSNMSVKYKENGTTTKTAAIPSAGLSINPNVASTTEPTGTVKFTYSNDHTVKLANSNKSIQYNIANNVSALTAAGTVAWDNGKTIRALTDNTYTFKAGTTINVSGLAFTGNLTTNPLGQYMYLLTGATDIAASSDAISSPTGSMSTAFTDTTSNIAFTGSVTGTVTAPTTSAGSDGKVKYTLDNITPTTISLTGWKGTGLTLDKDNWTKNAAMTVDASSFFGDYEPDDNTPIITTEIENFFDNNKITGAKKYSGGDTPVDDKALGVIFTGIKGGGVKAINNNTTLYFFKTMMDTTDITFKEMTWGQGRTAASGYNFANLTSINANGLTFTNPVAATGTMDLLSNATDLSTTGTYTISGTPHSQNFNNASVDNGAALSGTLTGTISVPATGTVRYTLTNKELKGVNLAKWDSTKNAYALNSEWISGLGANTINASGFTAPTLTAGTSKEIITATSAIFDDDQIYGDQKYGPSAGQSTDDVKGVTFTGSQEKGVKASDNKKSLVYAAGDFSVTGISLGKMTVGDPRDAGAGYIFSGVNSINAKGLNFTNPGDATGTFALLTNASGITGTTVVSDGSHTQAISGADIGSGMKGSGTLEGNVSAVTGGASYTVNTKTLSGIDLSDWDGTPNSTPSGWTPSGEGIYVDTGGFDIPQGITPGTTIEIFTVPGGGVIKEVKGPRTYKDDEVFNEPDKDGIGINGKESGGIQKKAGDASVLTYTGIEKKVATITLGKINVPGPEYGNEYNFTNAVVDDTGLTFKNPDSVGNTPVVLMTSKNNTLPTISATDKEVSYTYSPVSGVSLNGQIQGSYSSTSSSMTYTATSNKALKLTFGNVEWKDTGSLMTRPANISFDGADVDTTNINFTNIKELEANNQMTLVSNFDGDVGTITGSKYKVGSTLQGEGKASLDGTNLIFTADTTAEKMQVQEQTHNTLMGASSSMASLSQGNEFIGTTFDEMFLGANVGRDGIASYAHIGGGSMRQETGSHVNTRTWNAIVAFGHRNKKPRNSFEYGAFLEYGTGNYTTYNGDERGDGSARYVGGGLLAKWINPSGLYVEGSLRGGSIHDDGYNLLRDAAGVPYSYNTDTPYYGFHLGVGKQIPMKGGSVLDVYAKYFYNHRNSTSFDAGGHYDLDGITSQIIRVGARYTVKRDKWNYYGGLAYEHELDGKAGGWADGMPIRGVDTGGGSFRAELGATVQPNDDVPLTLDFTLTGFAGKKQGVFGGMGLKFNF